MPKFKVHTPVVEDGIPLRQLKNQSYKIFRNSGYSHEKAIRMAIATVNERYRLDNQTKSQ